MKKTISFILDLLFTSLIFYSIYDPEWVGNRRWLWIAIGFLVIRVVIMIWSMFSKRPFIEILDDRVVLEGMSFERENIRSGRVFSARVNGQVEQYLEVAFKTNPKLPLWFRLRQFFTDSGYPIRCAHGIPLAKKPRIIIPMGDTPLTDERIHQALSKSEQADASNGEKPPC